MDEAWHDFDRFMKQREEAAAAFVRGDAAPLGRLVTHEAPATFFGPAGTLEQGPQHVLSLYEADSSRFLSGQTHLQILHVGASGDLAYWVGLQHATARLEGQLEEVPMSLRVTEVFRREGGAWRLVHRHADVLNAAAAGKTQSAAGNTEARR